MLLLPCLVCIVLSEMGVSTLEKKKVKDMDQLSMTAVELSVS